MIEWDDRTRRRSGGGHGAPFEADPRRLHLVGCAFDPKTRLLSDWEER